MPSDTTGRVGVLEIVYPGVDELVAVFFDDHMALCLEEVLLMGGNRVRRLLTHEVENV